MKNVCLTIGIETYSNLESLPGAVTAAKEFGLWASQSGYDTKVVTDEHEAVTLQTIIKALEELLDVNEVIDSFVLHFAGHGYRTGAEQHAWLTSNWEEENASISVEGLKRALYSKEIKNISIFSDSCRSLPVDTTVSDLIPQNLINSKRQSHSVPKVYRFNAAMDGKVAYMVKSQGGVSARCVFSTVILEGLYGINDKAYSDILTDCVIPESLALFTEERMAEIGEIYDFKCLPEYSLVAPRDSVIYLDKKVNVFVSEPEIKWPPVRNIDFLQGESRSDGLILQRNSLFKEQSVQLTTQRVIGAYGSCSIRGANLHIFGKVKPTKIWSTKKTIRINERNYLIEVEKGSFAQILVEFENDKFMSCIVYHELVTFMAFRYYNFQGWLCVNRYEKNASIHDTIIFLERFRLGDIRAKDVEKIAIKFRYQKHANPIMGAICSYLYDYTGDVDSIRRMAYYYCMNEQPIPYDIVQMSMLPISVEKKGKVFVPGVEKSAHFKPEFPEWVYQSTKSTSGSIAGYWPWLKQGWQFANDNLQFKDIKNHLLPGEYTSFDRIGAEILIEKFSLRGEE